MESISSKLKAKRESLNISLEQISRDTHISRHHLESLENSRYEDLPGGMYNRAILRSYCDELGLDKDEILRGYDDEITPRSEKPAISSSAPSSSKAKTHTAILWSLILIFCVGLFLGRGWLISALSPYFSSDYSRSSSDLSSEEPHAPVKTANAYTAAKSATDAQAATINTETARAASPDGDDKSPVASPERIVRSVFAAGNDKQHPLRIEIVGKEECWLSVNRDESGAVTTTLSPGDVEYFTAARTIFLVVGNAGGVSLRINDRAARSLGRPGQVVRLTIDKDTLQNLIDPSAS